MNHHRKPIHSRRLRQSSLGYPYQAYDDDSQIVSKTTSKIYGFENAVIISINRHPTDGV